MPDRSGTPTQTYRGIQLFCLGFLTLFLELALIRYLAGNIWNLGYFPNLVLLSVFIGMGTGFIFHHYFSSRLSTVLFHSSYLTLLSLLIYVFFKHPAVPLLGEWKRSVGGELFFSIASPQTVDTNLLPFIVVFIFIIAIFFLISQRTAKLFRIFRPLTAYTLDIGGSCAGIISFMVISWLRIPAFYWFGFVSLLLMVALDDKWKTRWLPLIPAIVLMTMVYQQDQKNLSNPGYNDFREIVWSPYQKLEFLDSQAEPFPSIEANGIPHQILLKDDDLRVMYYQEPYANRQKRPTLPPFSNVLVIGAGTGNDVAAALLNGATHVDAVEIDPVIAGFGQKYHPSKPYQDSRVTLTIDDGRAFMTNTKNRYDLIIFALTDSVVKVSSMSQLRLENYLFTEESVARAFDLLTDQGEIVLYNYYRQVWLVNKLREIALNATNRVPEIAYFADNNDEMFFTIMTIGKYFDRIDPNQVPRERMDTPTDDWPFLYLKQKGIPSIYKNAFVGLCLFILLLMTGMHFATRAKERQSKIPLLTTKLAFIFMGTAFLLLETKSVIQFSLLFGTTWINNSLVFLAILVLVLTANWSAALIKDQSRINIIYVLLILSCLLPFAYPLRNLLQISDITTRFLLASLVTFSPIFFANLIFSLAFREQALPEQIFGWNLIGSTIGGILEYTSMMFGYSVLALIVAGCYTLVFIFLQISIRTANKAGPSESIVPDNAQDSNHKFESA